MRKLWPAVLELVILLSLCCLPVSAAEYEADCFEDLEKAFADKSGEDVTIIATEDIDWGGSTLTAKEGITYHISGDEDLVLKRVGFDGDGTVNIQAAKIVETKGHALMTSGNVTVNVCADLGGDSLALICLDNSSVTVAGNISSGDGIQLNNNSTATVHGDINCGGIGIITSENSCLSVIGNISAGSTVLTQHDNSKIEVCGNVTSTYDSGLSMWGNGDVTITGNIIAGEIGVYTFGASSSCSVTILGDICAKEEGVLVGENSLIKITGNVRGGDGNPKFKNEQNGYYGIGAGGNANVTVTGNVIGGKGYGLSGRGGYGILADGESTISVTGNVTGGNVDTGSAAGEEGNAQGGDGLYMINSATVSIIGDVTGGDIVSGQGVGGNGIHVRMRNANIDGGQLTVSGTAKGTAGGKDLYIVNEMESDSPEICIPRIDVDTCGETDCYGFTDEARNHILSSVTIHNKVTLPEEKNAFSIVAFFRNILFR